MTEKKNPKYVFFDGEIVSYEEAKIHMMTPCVRYGALVFEGLRAYWNEKDKQLYVFRMIEHSKRLIRSTKLSRMEQRFSIDDANDAILGLLRTLNYKEDLHLRHSIFVDGNGPVGSSGPVKMALAALPRGREHGFENGLNVSVSSWIRIDDTMMPPRIKASANYLNSRLAVMQAKLDGYDSCIFMNASGKTAEGPGACLIIVKDGQVFTPPVTAGILESITRNALINISKDILGAEIIERDIDKTELYVSDEILFCGSGAEITPIISVDRYQIGNGKIGGYTKKLRTLFFDIVRGCNKNFSEWLTPVY